MFTPLAANFLDMTNQVPGVSSVVGESERQVAQAEAKMTINLCKGKNPCNVVYMPLLSLFPPSKGAPRRLHEGGWQDQEHQGRC